MVRASRLSYSTYIKSDSRVQGSAWQDNGMLYNYADKKHLSKQHLKKRRAGNATISLGQ